MQRLLPLILLIGCTTKVTAKSSDPLGFVAQQDKETWKAVPTDANGGYAFDVSDDYAFAYGCENADGSSVVTVVYATAAEVTAPQLACNLPINQTNTVMVSGKLSGLGLGQTGKVDVGSATSTVAIDGTDWTVQAAAGTRDLFARRFTDAMTWDKVVRKNDVVLAAGARFDIDFATEGSAPETHTVTATGATADETVTTLVIFRNADGKSPHAAFYPGNTFLSMPASMLRATDGSAITVAASAGPTATAGHSVLHLQKVGADFSVALPPIPAAPTVTSAGDTPYVLMKGTVVTSFDADVYTFNFSQRPKDTNVQHTWTLQMTRGWMTKHKPADVTIPDVSGVAGFKTIWAIVKGSEVSWQQVQTKTNGSVSTIFDGSGSTLEIIDGREVAGTRRNGTFTP